MSTTTMVIGQNVAKRIAEGVSRPINNAKTFFQGLGSLIFQQTMTTFKLKGARAGHKAWKNFKMSTLITPKGTWRIRYGTDRKPKRKRAEFNKYKTENNYWFRPGIMPGYEDEPRYERASKLLQSSGHFRDSFQVLKTTKRYLMFGSTYNDKLVKDIQSRGRHVVFVTNRDYRTYGTIWKNFIDKNIKFK